MSFSWGGLKWFVVTSMMGIVLFRTRRSRFEFFLLGGETTAPGCFRSVFVMPVPSSVGPQAGASSGASGIREGGEAWRSCFPTEVGGRKGVALDSVTGIPCNRSLLFSCAVSVAASIAFG